MNQKIFAVVFSGLILLCNGLEGSNKKTIRILFIGNSYTYYNSMPQLFKAIAEYKIPDLQFKVDLVAAGGATLKQHWNDRAALGKIRSGKWDFVVLQEQSMLGTAVTENNETYFGSPVQFFEHARKFNKEIRRHGAETVLFMTWSRHNYEHQQKFLTYAYITIAEELNSKIAPVGMAWDKLRNNKNLNLYMEDGAHPSVHGSFLSAAMLFTTIFDIQPTGVPGQLKGYEILRDGNFSNEKTLLCQIPDTEVSIILEATVVLHEQMKMANGYPEVEEAVSEREPAAYFFTIFCQLGSAEGQVVFIILISMAFLIIKAGIRLFTTTNLSKSSD